MLLRYLKNKKKSQKALGNKVTIVAWKELMSVAKTKRFNQEGKADRQKKTFREHLEAVVQSKSKGNKNK